MGTIQEHTAWKSIFADLEGVVDLVGVNQIRRSCMAVAEPFIRQQSVAEAKRGLCQLAKDGKCSCTLVWNLVQVFLTMQQAVTYEQKALSRFLQGLVGHTFRYPQAV